MSAPIKNDKQQRLYDWLIKKGADVGAIEFSPHEYLRKTGFLAVPTSVEIVKEELMILEEDGWVLIGPATEAGHMVIATEKMNETLILPFERMVTLHAQMTDIEREMLKQWEETNLGGPDGLATSDWPGWSTVYKRLSH